MVSWNALGRALPAGLGKWFDPSTWPLWGCVCAPQYKGDMELLEQVQRRALKRIRRLKQLLWGKAEEARPAQPQKEKNERGPHQCLSVSDDTVSKRWIQALISRAKQQDKRRKLTHRSSTWTWGRTLLCEQTHRDRLCANLEIFKNHQDTILCHVL